MLEKKYKSLKVKALKAEEENIKLSREIDLSQRSMKGQKEKYKAKGHKFRLSNWLEKI